MQDPICMELTPEGKHIRLAGADLQDRELVKRTPGARWDKADQSWQLPAAWGSCLIARDTWGDRLQIGPRLNAWAQTEKQRRDKLLSLREAECYAFEPSPKQNQHDEYLYPFQAVGRDFLVDAGYAILGDEMGSGKTFQTLAAIRVTNAYPVLIVCPNTLKRNWDREIRQWLPEANPHIIHGAPAKRRKQLAAAAAADRAVIIMNIEAIRLHSRLAPYGSTKLKRCTGCDPKAGNPKLTTVKCETHPKELNNIEFKTFVIDEAHRTKDARSLQSRAIKAVAHQPTIAHRWALTGTPIANHPGDLWSILNTLAPTEYPSRTAFIDRYALTRFNPFGGMDIIGLRPDHKEEFHALLDPHFRRMLKSTVLPQLPSKTFLRRDVEITKEQAKAYEDIHQRMITRLEDGTLLVANGNLPAATRMLQFASAYCDIDKGDTPDELATWSVTLAEPSSKIDELMSIIEDNPGRPLAIAAEHRQLIDLVSARLTKNGIKHGLITGGVTADERAQVVQDFQNGIIDYVLFTYKAGGVGVTLTRADMMVRLQRSWSLVDNMQGEDRIHRIGSERHDKVTILDLVTAGTIEEHQLAKIRGKADRLDEITRDRERLAKLGQDTAALESEQACIENEGLL